MMLNPVALNCHGAQPYNRVNVMMSNPVTSKSYGEQLHNGVNFMMSNHITLKKKYIRAKKKLTTNKNARCVGFEHIYMFV